MEYLYLPTTTLNFNNILSTGSISPPKFYLARRFGYNQFETVEPNPFANVLLLYDRYPDYTINDAYKDSHPLVIRLRTTCLPKTLTKQQGKNSEVNIYSCDETIYFEPSSADLYFAYQDVQRIVVSKSEPSLTTKLVELYRPCMHTQYPVNCDPFKWSDKILEGILDSKTEVSLKSSEADNRINRLKGFVSGYIIGAYKSITPEIARYRSDFRAIRNKVSAMLNDPTRNYSKTLCQEVDFSCITLESFLAEDGIGTQRFDPSHGDSIRINQGEITVLRDRNKTGDYSTESLLRLVNGYCLTSEFNGQLDENRLNVAIEGGTVIRSLIGAQWESSSYKTYINALLNNTKSGSTFNFNDSDSLAMKSFAAFILKGDDLDKLEAFLTLHGIGDFRIAFALWGAMFGFSKISKKYYNLSFQQGDAEYAKKMHAYTHSVVHNIPFDDIFQLPFIPAVLPVEVKPPTGEPSLFFVVQSLLDQLQQKLPGSTPWHAKLNELLIANGGLGKGFITLLNKKTNASELGLKLPKGTTKKAVVDFFEEALKSQHLERRSNPMPLFERQQTAIFWKDAQVWENLRDVVPSQEQKRVKDDLEWFQSEWQNPNSKYYGWENATAKGTIRTKPLIQRTNNEAINAFCKVLSSYLHETVLSDIRRLLVKWYS